MITDTAIKLLRDLYLRHNHLREMKDIGGCPSNIIKRNEELLKKSWDRVKTLNLSDHEIYLVMDSIYLQQVYEDICIESMTRCTAHSDYTMDFQKKNGAGAIPKRVCPHAEHFTECSFMCPFRIELTEEEVEERFNEQCEEIGDEWMDFTEE